MNRGAWWAVVLGGLKSGTQLSNSLSLFTFHFPLSCIGEGNGNPFQCSCLENPRDGSVSWAALYGVAQSPKRLKRLSSSSSSSKELRSQMPAATKQTPISVLQTTPGHHPLGRMLKASLQEEPVDTFLSLPGRSSRPSQPPAPLNPLPGSQTHTPHLPPRRALILLDGSMLPPGPDHPRASRSISGPTASPLNPSAWGPGSAFKGHLPPECFLNCGPWDPRAHPTLSAAGARSLAAYRDQLRLLAALHLQGPRSGPGAAAATCTPSPVRRRLECPPATQHSTAWTPPTHPLLVGPRALLEALCLPLLLLLIASVLSGSWRPHEPWPTRPLCPWDSPGKNTGVG